MTTTEEARGSVPAGRASGGAGRRLVPGWLLRIGVAVGVLFAAAMIVGRFVDLGPVLRPLLEPGRRALEHRIERGVHIGSVHLHLVPSIELVLGDVIIDAVPPMADAGKLPPLARVAALRIGVATWPLVASRGRDLRIQHLDIDAPAISLLRLPDGSLSVADLFAPLFAGPFRPPTLSPDEVERVRAARLERFDLHDGTLEIRDYFADSGRPPSFVRKLTVGVRDARAGAPFPLLVSASIDGETPGEPNFHIDLEVASVPADLQLSTPLQLLRRLDVRVDGIDLARLDAFTASDPAQPRILGRLSGDYHLELPSLAGDLKIRGALRVQGLAVKAAARGGGADVPPADFAAHFDLGFEPLTGGLSVKSLELELGDMGFSGAVDVRALWIRPSVSGLRVATHDLRVERLLAYLPPAFRPAGAAPGPLSLALAPTAGPRAVRLTGWPHPGADRVIDLDRLLRSAVARAISGRGLDGILDEK